MTEEYIFAMETSCDETAVCIGKLNHAYQTFEVTHNIVRSQIAEHQEYGGVVPFLAARLHTKTLPPLIIRALQEVREQDNHFSLDYIAVTRGPGLEPALYTGVNQANVMGATSNAPVLGVNHLHGHIWSYLVPSEGQTVFLQEHDVPFLALVVSGGHTALVLVKNFGFYEVLGQTIDDAAGEAFDKVASMLGLGYPGGPIVSKRAAEGDPHRIDFPRPMSEKPGLDVSFSGLKTSVLYYIKEQGGVEHLSDTHINDICASFQQAVVDTLLIKVRKALKQYGVHKLVLGGGVAANPLLRQELETVAQEFDIPLRLPSSRVTADNALIIAVDAGLGRLYGHRGQETVEVDPNLRIEHT